MSVHTTDNGIIPASIRIVADAVDAAVESRLRRTADSVGEGLVVDPAHVDFLPRRQRRYSAAWKIVSHCGIVLRVDVSSDDEGITVAGRVNGHVVATATRRDDVTALVTRIAQTLDALGVRKDFRASNVTGLHSRSAAFRTSHAA